MAMKNHQKLPSLEKLDDFLLYLTTNNYSEETIKNYERDLKAFEIFLREEDLKFTKLTRRDVERYKSYLVSQDRLTINQAMAEEGFVEGRNRATRSRGSKTFHSLSSRSINRMLSSLRSYFRYLTKMGWSAPLSRDEVELIRSERKKGRVAELLDLIRVIESPTQFEKSKRVALRNRAMLETLFATGMRISELIKLNREQIDRSGRIFIEGKGKKERFVYLTPRAKSHLDEYLRIRKDDCGALFIPYRGSAANAPQRRVSKNYLQMKIKEYVRRLGINVPTSAHSLRHGYGTYLAEGGASPVAIQLLLGHESPATTDRYIHASDKFAEREHQKHHPLYELTEPNKGRQQKLSDLKKI